MKNPLLYAVSACTLLAGSAQAAIIASYDFAGGSLVATTQQFGTAGDATLGSAFSTDTGANLSAIGAGTITTDGLFYTAANGGTNTNVASNQVVFSFTVSGLNAGETLQIDSLSMDYDGTGVGTNTYRFNTFLSDTNAATPTASFRDAGQFDPGASGTYTELLSPTSAAGTGQTAFSNGETFSVAFGSRDNQSQNSAYDNLVLNGTVVPVPEPSSSALLAGLLGLGLIVHRRRA